MDKTAILHNLEPLESSQNLLFVWKHPVLAEK